MSDDSDLYGEDILLWSKKQSELLRRLAAGERVTDQVDWPNVVGEIADVGHDHAQPPTADPGITELRQQLARAEATVVELRERLDDALAKLADAQAELAVSQDHAEAVSARGGLTSAFPPLSQGAVTSTLFSCLDGHEAWVALYEMRYGANPVLDQRQCKICVEARMPNGDTMDPCEELQCRSVATPAVGQNCVSSHNPNVGVCRMPDRSVLPQTSPSGCIARGGDWMMSTSITK
jgi:hypothetical protein